MKPILLAKEMKYMDQYTIESIGIQGCVLMERAALFAVNCIERYIHNMHLPHPRIAILCGNGNNGGDGYAIGRLLHQKGYDTTVIAAFVNYKKSIDNEHQLMIFQKIGGKLATSIPDMEYDILVDALFGIGLNRNLEGEYADVVNRWNKMDGVKFSVDIPSGLHTDTGCVMGCSIKADYTLAMQYHKVGFYLGKGKEYCGEIICGDVGIVSSIPDFSPKYFTYTEPANTLLPVRKPTGNKGTFGKLLMIAGTRDMAGACILCARAAYEMGCGMVKVITSKENREIIQTSIPEALLYTLDYDSDRDYHTILESIEWADGVVIGPGLGRDKAAECLVDFCLDAFTGYPDKCFLWDADALWHLSNHWEWKQRLNMIQAIFTPHMAEFAKLMYTSVPMVISDNDRYINDFLKEYKGVLVLKNATTRVFEYNRKQAFVNICGNDGMATAGSGDVLAGMIGALMIRGLSCFDAATLGVYFHSLSGDLSADKVGRDALMASDIIYNLKGTLENGVGEL